MEKTGTILQPEEFSAIWARARDIFREWVAVGGESSEAMSTYAQEDMASVQAFRDALNEWQVMRAEGIIRERTMADGYSHLYKLLGKT